MRALVLMTLIFLASCATNPACQNPRSMACMPADELIKELSK